MFKIKLLISLLISFIFLSCAKNTHDQNGIKYSLSYIGGQYEGLILKNLLINNLSNQNLYSDNSIYLLRPSISHKSNVFITNIDNTSDRVKIKSELIIEVVNKRFNCVTQKFDESITQFYIIAAGDKFISNNRAEKKIIEDNTEALVKDFINKLKKPDAFCKKLNE